MRTGFLPSFQRNKLLIPTLAMLLFAACQKEKIKTVADEGMQPARALKMIIDEPKATAEHNKIIRDNERRLQNLEETMKGKGKKATIHVPADFPTIQEAVDNASPGGNIHVSPGTYTEQVVINTPGLDLKAHNGVTLIGRFVLLADADNVKIQKFTIQAVPEIATWAISGRGLSGLEIKDNTIPALEGGALTFGIRLVNSSNNTIQNNVIDGAYWGIVFSTSTSDPAEADNSNDNRIHKNTVTNNNGASAIHLNGNCDNNSIDNNVVTGKTNIFNAGITLASTGIATACDKNTIKNNISSDGSTSGFWEWGSGSDNTVGPNNQFNNNVAYGILIGFTGIPLGTRNVIFNNKVQNNMICDIVDEGGTANNTYKKNKYNCFSSTP